MDRTLKMPSIADREMASGGGNNYYGNGDGCCVVTYDTMYGSGGGGGGWMMPSIADIEAYKCYVKQLQREIDEAFKIPVMPPGVVYPWSVMSPKNVVSMVSMVSAVPDNETKEQYNKRMIEKAETRLAKEAADLTKKKADDNKDKHWTDKLYKPFPGAVGSAYEFKF